MPRAAAEIEPKAAICSSSSILPGPMRPSGSRLILQAERWHLRVSVLRRLVHPALRRHRRAPTLGPNGRWRPVEAHRLDDGEDLLAGSRPSIVERLAGDARRDRLRRCSRASRRPAGPSSDRCRRSVPARTLSALSPRGRSVAIITSRARMRTRTRAPTRQSTPGTRISPAGDARTVRPKAVVVRRRPPCRAPRRPRRALRRGSRSSRCRISRRRPDAADPAVRQHDDVGRQPRHLGDRMADIDDRDLRLVAQPLDDRAGSRPCAPRRARPAARPSAAGAGSPAARGRSRRAASRRRTGGPAAARADGRCRAARRPASNRRGARARGANQRP